MSMRILIVSRPRQGGKTHEMAEWAKADPNRVMLVHHEAERQRLIREYGLSERQVMRAEGARERLAGRHDFRVGVDNIDLLGWRTLLKLAQLEPYMELVTETRGF